jgi:hypothetical protein
MALTVVAVALVQAAQNEDEAAGSGRKPRDREQVF